MGVGVGLAAVGEIPRTAVVTGAGSGIGKAIAARLVQGGVRVVVNDIDPAAAKRSAEDVGGLAVACDAASAEGIAFLHSRAIAHLGEIDAWFANAGIDRGRGLRTSDADWYAAFEVNVMAHVRAARLLVPVWVERGCGRFVVTASAAGLLTMLGGPAYAVSKHGAVAWAEWLSATYQHRGLVVQALCPQGVRTDMLVNAGGLVEMLSHDNALAPETVAEFVWQALADDRFLILPHAEVANYTRRRGADRERWLRGMNRVQQGLEADGSIL